ncbi:MAG: CoA-acylating methylmalonate-semialdehyde dehydrogenase [Bryobacteraceae bacterium]|nr:CoA-acylating methylmalonate-semialdehyde dehydrogenase [Bryobacteraceae bacterium]MDW8377081.1 CoA-acylating methylmalonate-semialdehyde dehydrogenase [Bryobacterales bacterium]
MSHAVQNAKPVLNYYGGAWRSSQAGDLLPVCNPATAEVLGYTPLSTPEEVDAAVRSAAAAWRDWRRTPATERVQPLFRLKQLLEENLEELARTITLECGKTLVESRGEMRRAIENVEVASGIPILMQGNFSEEIARGVDEFSIRQPLGVCAILAPFNFPGMIPFWFLPYALACGNTVVLKPSERVPLTMQKVLELLELSGFPPGCVNVVNGGKAVAEELISHPLVRAVSFVGSSAVAKSVYAKAAAHGKRVQCQGGAKNPIVVLPDADVENATPVIADSAFGCAGQRCLAASLAILVGEAAKEFGQSIREAAATRRTGNGLEDVQMGPVISPESRSRIEGLIAQAERDGAQVTVDGRNPVIPRGERGNFIRPTIIEDLPLTSSVAHTEIFGPVLSLHRVDSIEAALEMVNSGAYGNAASVFTTSGEAARRFRSEAEVGNVGINIGVAAPMAFFPFSGARESFFGDLHGQGRDAVRFFTQEKVVIERWPKEWSRKF